MTWLTESLRLTAFTDPPTVDTSVGWWQALAGEPPAVASIERLGPILRQQGPAFKNLCNFTLEYRPGRVDWLMSPIIPPSLKLDEFPNFGELTSVTDRFRSLCREWLATAPATKRFAVGVVCVMPVADKNSGYRELQKLLPAVKLDPENSADFSYQINRYRQSKTVQSLRINRLSKWAVAMLSGIRIEITGGQQAQAIEAPEGLSACRIELDINTQPDRAEVIPRNLVTPLFDELLQAGLEIAERGEIP